jgi:hypothetical protein
MINQGSADNIEAVQRELAAFSQALATLESYNLVAEVRLYDVPRAAPTFMRTFEVSRLRRSFLCKQTGLIVLFSPNRTIIIDEVHRKISCQPAQRLGDLNTKIPEADELGMRLREFSQRGIQISSLGSSSSEIRLSAVNLVGVIQQMDLFLDPTTHLAKRIVYKYRAEKDSLEASTEILYTWKDPSGLRPEDFLEDTYVRVENDVILPSEKYKSFEIICSGRMH